MEGSPAKIVASSVGSSLSKLTPWTGQEEGVVYPHWRMRYIPRSSGSVLAEDLLISSSELGWS